MINIIKGSILYSFILSIISIYHKGFICKSFNKIQSSYQYSKTAIIWSRFAGYLPSLGLYGKFTNKCNVTLRKLGFIYRKSLIYKIQLFFAKIIAFFFKSSIFGKIGYKKLLILAFTLYLPLDYFLRSVINIGFLSSIWDEGLMIAVLVFILYKKAMTSTISKATPLDMYIYMFLGVGFFLMCAVAPNTSIAFDGYRAVIQYILWFFLIMNLIEDDSDFRLFYGTLITVAIIIALHGFYQFIVKTPIPEHWTSQAEASVRTRSFSITGSPNVLGSFLVLFTPMVAGLIYYLKNGWMKFIALSITGMMCLSLIFTSSKGAWGGMFVAVVIFAICLDRKIIALMLASAGVALVAIPSIADRITFLFTADYVEASMRGGRMVRWETGKELLSSVNEWLGFGLGRFGGAVAMQNKVIEETETFKYFYMDNYYLKTLVEMGYLGLIFFLIMLVGLIIILIRSIYRVRNDNVFPLAVSMFAGMMGVLVHCYFENIFEVPYMTAYFWALAAGIIYLGYFRKKDKHLRGNSL